MTRAYSFQMTGEETLLSMVHPSDEQKLDFVEIYSLRDTMDNFRKSLVNIMRGTLVYALREEDNPKKNIQYLRRYSNFHSFILIYAKCNACYQ